MTEEGGTYSNMFVDNIRAGNGMKSAISHLGNQNFPRLRIGIGKPQNSVAGDEANTISYVLGQFNAQESAMVTEILSLVVDCVELSLKQGVEQAMNRYNNRSILVKSN